MRNLNGYLVASLLWGLNIPLSNQLLHSFDPFWLAACRHTVAVLILGAWVWAALGRGQLRSPIALPRVAVMSLAVAGFLVLFNLGLMLSSPINAAAVLAASPVVVALVSWLMTGARLERGFWGALLLALLGAGIALQGRALTGTAAGSWRGGEVLIALAVASWTAYSILSQRWFAKDVDQLRRTWLTSTGAVLWLFAVWLLARASGLAGSPQLHPSAADIGTLFTAALLCTAVATVAWNHGVARLGIQAGAMWQNMVPVFAVLLSLLLFGVVPTAAQVLGGAVVFSGVLWMQWHKRRAQQAASLLLVLACLSWLPSPAQAAEVRQLIAPHETDDRLPPGDPPHLVVHDTARTDALLLVWLPGTGGAPASGPQALFDTALQQGHRLLALSTVNMPAVSQVCVGAVLRSHPQCAAQMRQHRVWGEPLSGLVNDRPEDAIVARLTRLLQHLTRSSPAGQWQQYLDGDAPRWSRLLLAGQSQGGGMAAFIAQTRQVAGVVMFSGGWDQRPGGDIASWYSRPSQTPAQRWHATFHVDEPQAATMQRIYRQLGLPPENIHGLAEPVKGQQAHGEGIRNPVYRPLWEQMLQPQR
jgi:drug/metabolite transporter (DMT)-like permease